jgi:hypothetical protein
MAYASDTIWDDTPSGNTRLPPIRTSWLVSGAAVLGLGVALAGWSLVTVAAVHRMETSLSSTPTLLPESAFAPGAVALFDPVRRVGHAGDSIRQRLAGHAIPVVHGSSSVSQAETSLHRKSARISASARTQEPVLERTASSMPLQERFGEARSEMPAIAHRRASAFIRSRLEAAGSVKSTRVALAALARPPVEQTTPATGKAVALPVKVALIPEIPSDNRFAHEVAEAVPALLRDAPLAGRFGPRTDNAEKPSRIALAVIDAELNEDTGVSPPLPSAPPARNAPALSDDAVDDTDTRTDDSVADSSPDSVPLPTWRPNWEKPAPAARPEPAPSHSSNTMMAYAKPDDGEDTGPLSGLAKLFERKPRLPGAGSGVAVYDIRNAVVYMPNGDKLEAHSGLGHMVDKPRFASVKMRGPTPPNTYKLVLRERRFHGVEAIRLLPVDGKKKFGRDGLLAHTYMLRGGLAQSNGCVVFKDYKRFLKAFKRGKITRLVVVPDISHASPAVIASAARGA